MAVDKLLRLFLPALCFLCLITAFVYALNLTSLSARASLSFGSQHNNGAPPGGGSFVEPGRRIGPLKLGDTQERALELFPLKADIDQEYVVPNCGTEYEWLDLDNHQGGNVLIIFKDNLVSQISSTINRYRTIKGTGPGSSPDEVRRHYKELSAYLYLGRTPEALNESPLVVWSDSKRGIAFTFLHRSRSDRRFSVYSVIVFPPESSFCEQDAVVPDPQTWRKLVPYSLAPPNAPAGKSRVSASSSNSLGR